MQYVSDANEIEDHLRDYAYAQDTDPELAKRIKIFPGVQAERLAAEAETLYVYRDKLNETGLRVMCELFMYAREHSWSGFNRGPDGSNNRTEQIIALCERDLGETGAHVAKKDAEWPDPEINRRDGFDWRKLGSEVQPPAAA